MEGEGGGDMMNLIKLCLPIGISLGYSYWICRFIPAGTTRLIFLLPIICFNISIPLSFSSVHLSGTIGFFFAWLSNFKLLLFAFGKGPLSDQFISLPRFAAIACLPIKIQPNQPHRNGNANGNYNYPPSQTSKLSDFDTDPSSKTPNTTRQSKKNFKGTPLFQYAIKGLLLGVLLKIYDFSDLINPNVLMCMYLFHIYFLLEIILAINAALARTLLGFELEPQFNDPLLSTSLQDFWGRRWNLMVTSILRPTVYEPTMRAAEKVVGVKWAPVPAVLGTFVVSGVMHELILFYMGRMGPTFRMSGFFVLHGICVVLEIALKKVVTARWRLPRLVSGPLTAGFVFGTCIWLFLPEFIRCGVDVKAFEDYAALAALLKNFVP
ncbi:hypothetical protein RJT34_31527 [Clitoria ternatea]|uniref:Wax synthase domain-containing protein n=1 Tax=Clitoria ternatea TaxID=43366 RepID=A0AAN9F2A0_CLITE